ncbi:MAG TPA: VOC family protein [Pseudonocardia sp.]|jgi:predicted lactoylglutathione lyase|uniref:VOC family protein n=1 Tax=Pseudonocardia sp. TaxID=60912 RepID=UPI002C1CCFEB|nr:VOC family protein [Pseudonocardia sp.]HTF46906.1 VOC family protein [Pseudonocardia sp.]
MDRMIFVNLPVTDLTASKEFYTGLGFRINQQFSDEQTACIVVSETICVMLLVNERFADFITGEISDAHRSSEVLLCLSAESRAEVDQLVASALAHGGKPWQPVLEHGPMYGHSFADPDGHVWEVMHMDMAAAE